MVKVEVGETSIYIHRNIYNHWEKYGIAYLQKKNQDRVYIVDGMEGAGKSLWTIQQSSCLDPSIFSSPKEFVKHVVFDPKQFNEAAREFKNTVIIFDEAFRGFSSRSALSKVNKELVSTLMEMRQNNNIVFIVLPRIFMLDMYPAMLRSNGLFNVYIDKASGRRYWRGWNYRDKNKIYQVGAKRGWSYPIKTSFKGDFFGKFPGGEEFEKAYLAKKREAFKSTEERIDEMAISNDWWRKYRDEVIIPRYLDWDKPKKPTITELAYILGVTRQTISAKVSELRQNA